MEGILSLKDKNKQHQRFGNLNHLSFCGCNLNENDAKQLIFDIIVPNYPYLTSVGLSNNKIQSLRSLGEKALLIRSLRREKQNQQSMMVRYRPST
jgi:hypothetical protein